MTSPIEDGIDFAVAAYREEGVWQVAKLAHEVLADAESIVHALRRFPGDGGALGMISIDEDFCLVFRVAGPQVRVLLSDVTAAEEWELAAGALELIGLPAPDDDEEPGVAGDLNILADMGYPAMDLGILLDDVELYPDEILIDIASKLGFGPLFEQVADLTSA